MRQAAQRRQAAEEVRKAALVAKQAAKHGHGATVADAVDREGGGADGEASAPLEMSEKDKRAAQALQRRQAAEGARKAELLKKQDRRGAYDAKVLFGGDFQAGKRETPRSSSEDTRKKLPVVGDFLFPNDVGGVNLQTGGR